MPATIACKADRVLAGEDVERRDLEVVDSGHGPAIACVGLDGALGVVAAMVALMIDKQHPYHEHRAAA